MKYNISLSGRGSDSRIFKLKDTEYFYLKESGVEEDKLEFDDIEKYLKKELLFDDADEYVVGPYFDDVWVTVEDELGELIFEGDSFPDNVIDSSEWGSIEFEGSENYFVLEDYSKGNFLNFQVEDDVFDINKLSFIIKDIAEIRDIIIGVKYNGEDVTETIEYGDYWSKGFYYLLSEKFNKIE